MLWPPGCAGLKGLARGGHADRNLHVSASTRLGFRVVLSAARWAFGEHAKTAHRCGAPDASAAAVAILIEDTRHGTTSAAPTPNLAGIQDPTAPPWRTS